MASKVESKAGPRVKEPSEISGRSSSSGSRLLFFILIALALFTGATYVAFQQSPKPDPYAKSTLWESFYYPQEKNAFMRLPVINGTLNDIFVLPEGKRLWAVGNQGLIVYSLDGGKTWQQQNFPIKEQLAQFSLSPPSFYSSSFNRVIQPDAYTQLLPSTTKLSFFPSVQAAAPEPIKQDQQQTIQDIKRADAERSRQVQNVQTQPQQQIQVPEPQQQQQQLKQTEIDNVQQQLEQAFAEEEPADTVEPPTKQPAPQQELPNLNAVYFVNQDTGFIVGEKGMFLKTTNGGNEWQAFDTGIDSHLNSVTFIANGLNGWAVGDRGIIISTEDGGASWRPAPATRLQPGNLNSVAFAEDGQRGWAVGDKGMVLSTTDGGQRWQLQKNITNNDLASIKLLIDGRVGRIVDRSGRVFLTYDDGNEWTVQTQIQKDKKNLAVYANNDKKKGWLIDTDNSIVSTVDGGENWFPQTSRSHNFNEVVFVDNDKALIVGSNGIILFSDNGGVSWKPQVSGTDKHINDITFTKGGQQGWAVGGNVWSSPETIFQNTGPGIILSTDNGGENWNTDSYYDSVLNSIAFSADGVSGWVAGDNESYLTTVDAGKNWQWESSELEFFESYSDIAFTADGKRGWRLRNLDGSVLFSDDGGKSWQPRIQNLSQFLFSIAVSNEGQSVWAVGNNGTIISTDNEGENWVTQLSGTNKRLSSVAFSPDGLSGWIVGDNGTILSSRDSGNSWQRKSSIVGTNLYSVDIAGDNKKGLIVGGSEAIFYSHDSGVTWQQIQYTRTPAYWFWLLCFSFFCFAIWLITKKPSEVSTPEETVADLLASDKPLEPGDPDPLNFNTIALGLSRFMRNPATEPPLTVAITGAWGSGKSSLMNLLYHDLKSYGFTPVWFNAWHHQKGEQLLASLYANIKEQAIPSWFKFYKLMPVGLIFRLNLLAKRIKNHWLLTLVSLILTVFVFRFVIDTGFSWADLSPKKLLDSFLGEANGSIENLLILILGGPIAILIRWLQAFGISPEKLMTNRNGNKKDSNKVDPSARQAFAKEFKDVSSCLDTGRMVIFIDDLDRCSKENVVDILEAMNFLSVSGDCYIVVGMDETWVKICIENNFPDMVEKQQSTEFKSSNEKGFADNYLEKMINIPVPIPTLKETDAIDLLLPQESFSQPVSIFNKVSQAISAFVIRYRVIFSLMVCGVLIGVIATLIPKDFFKAVEVKQAKAEVKEKNVEALYEWDNVSLEKFSVVDGKPEIKISLNDKLDQKKLENDKEGLQLVLEGNPDLLEKGLAIATLGDKKGSANLILRRAIKDEGKKEQKVLLVEPIVSEPKLPEENETIEKVELLPGNPNISANDYWLPLVSLGLFIFGFIVYSLKTPNRFVEDSPHFKDALTIWQPWISLQRSTPRAIKRYVNYVRYLAMRYKAPEPEKSSTLSSAEENQNSPQSDINEENLVALSAIYAIEPTWLTDKDLFSKLKEGYIQQMMESKFKTAMAYTDIDQYNQLSQSLRSSIERHKKKFGNNAFEDSTVERFLDINTNTKFN